MHEQPLLLPGPPSGQPRSRSRPARVRLPHRQARAIPARDRVSRAGNRRVGKPHHLHALLDESDEGQKQIAVETLAIKLARRHVRGGDHHDAEFKQVREQPAEDHRIRNVGDVEFVEAKQPAFARNRGCGKRDRIATLPRPVLICWRRAWTRSCTSVMNS